MWPAQASVCNGKAFAALREACRSPEEQAAFDRALAECHLWWMHADVIKILLTSIPEGVAIFTHAAFGWDIPFSWLQSGSSEIHAHQKSCFGSLLQF